MLQPCYDEAADAIIRAVAFAYWERDRLAQAGTLTALGQGFKGRGGAGACVEMARKVCEEILATSPTAEQLHAEINQALGAIACVLKEPIAPNGQRKGPRMHPHGPKPAPRDAFRSSGGE